MGADAALINALTRAEYAKNVPDYSKIFEMSYGGVDAIMKGTLSAVQSISTAVSEKNKMEAKKQEVIAEDLKAWKEGVLNNFDTTVNGFYKQIAIREDGGKEAGMNPAMQKYAWDYMEGVRGELEGLVNQPKTRETAKGIMDLESKAQKFIDGLVGMRGDLLTFAQQAGSSNSESSVNKEATLAWDGGDGMEMASRLFKLDEEGWKGITPGMDEKGMFANIDQQVVLSKEELISGNNPEGIKYFPDIAEKMVNDGDNVMIKTTKLYSSDLSKLVQWKDEEGSTAIMTEVTTGAEMADTDDIKTRVALGDLTLDETTGQWRDVNGNPIFDLEGVKDNIAKNIRTSDSGDKKENLYDMIYREFNGQGSSYAESTKNHPVIKTARYSGIAVSSLVQDLPADADGDGDVELTSDGSGGWVDESGNAVLDTDWQELQGKLLKPRTQEEKDAVAEDIAWYFAKQSESKFNEKVSLLNRVKVKNDEVSNKTELTYAQLEKRDRGTKAAKKIDDLVKNENRSILDLKGTIGKEFDIEQEGNEYVIYKKYQGGQSESIRFNINDQNALSDALFEYSGSDDYYKKGKYNKYEYQEGDTKENPILKEDSQSKGEEGKYYKLGKLGIYQYINGKYKKVGSEGEEESSVNSAADFN